jgi:hypothetical protein
MSQPVVVHIPHQLGKDEAVRRMKRGFAHASATLPFLTIGEEQWAGDRLTFRLSGFGQAASGAADVADDDVRVEVVLPHVLQKFAELAVNTLKSRAQLLLQKM